MPKQTLAAIWANYGAYHYARAQALAGRFHLLAIQLAGSERLYPWHTTAGDPAMDLDTLKAGALERQRAPALAAAVWKRLSAHQPDAVLIPGWGTLPALAAALWARRHGVVSVLMSDSNYEDTPRGRCTEASKRLLVRALFDRAVVGGKRAAAYVSSLGIHPARVGLGYDVVDNDFFSEGADRLRSSPLHRPDLPAHYFLYVGRFSPEKNLSGLLSAFRAYRGEGGSWELVLVGCGPEAQSLRQQSAREETSETVHFAPPAAATGLLPFYALAGCFVLPSVQETWGLAVNEAMAAGLPVLVSDRCGCSDDLVDPGRNGFVFRPSRPGDLQSRLHAMAALGPGERLRMGQHSRQIISRYSLENWAAEVARIVALP